MFGSDGGAGPAEHPAPTKTSTADARAFLKAQNHTTFRSHRQRIVSEQNSNTATAATGAAAGGAGRCREPGTRTTRVLSSKLVRGPSYGLVEIKAPTHLLSTLANFFLLLLRHRMPACVPLSRNRQSSDLPVKGTDLHLELLCDPPTKRKTRIYFPSRTPTRAYSAVFNHRDRVRFSCQRCH
jgi:hypothetical protein